MKQKIYKILLGDNEYLEKEYNKIFGQKNYIFTLKIISANKKTYLLIIFVFLIFMLFEIVSMNNFNKDNLIFSGEYIDSLKRPKEGSYIIPMIAYIENSGSKTEKEFSIKINSKANPINENKDSLTPNEDRINLKIENMIRKIDKNEGNIIKLPLNMDENVSIKWKEKRKSNIYIIIVMFIICIGLQNHNKYSKISKIKKESKESIINELPEFINKIILMMNAGLVFSSAFSRVIEYEEKNLSKKSYFINQLIEAKKRTEKTNSSIIYEITSFAMRSEIREFVKIVNIISDNTYKGSKLVEKLQKENELLWNMRKKREEERIKMVETKLAFPLAIHLLVLIIITIAPAVI